MDVIALQQALATATKRFPPPPDVQVFTSSGSWTKPAGAKVVEVLAISGGGGGGSGRRGAAGTVRAGGGGGASGPASRVVLRASDLPSAVTVTVGAGGAGGAAVTVNDTNGNGGGAGQPSIFGSWCRPVLNANGAQGGSATGANGGLAQTNAGGTAGSVAGAAASVSGGVASNANGSGAATAGWQYATTGGGAGGGITTTDVPSNGSNGGQLVYSTNASGLAGVVGGALPGTNNAVGAGPGGGGGGGAASITTAAQAGAPGGLYGGGGGGGGASLNGNNSGAGGAGGSGVVVVVTHFEPPTDTGLWLAAGDSLTAGTGGGGTTYPGVLAGLLGTSVTALGVGGETSTQIASRIGAAAATATVTGSAISGTGTTTITTNVGVPSAQGSALGATVNGIRGTLTYTSGSSATFTRREAIPASVPAAGTVPVRFDWADAVPMYRLVIWAGRNNLTDPTAVLRDVAAMAARTITGKFLVLSVLNAGLSAAEVRNAANWVNIKQINDGLAAAYGQRYIDIRRYLIDNGLTDAGITPTAQDTTDISNDVVPASLRSDNIHLTAAGYTIVGQQVYARMQSLGWA
jgi:lysophospholipase L1-like esterase